MEVEKADKKSMPGKSSKRRVNGANFPARRIPSNALKRTLEIATNPVDGFWLNKNTSCAQPANYELYPRNRRSPTNEKLRLATTCLMQRDLKNLAKLLASNLVGDTVLQKDSYTVFAEYAEMLKKFTKLMATTTKSSEQSTENTQEPAAAQSENFSS